VNFVDVRAMIFHWVYCLMSKQNVHAKAAVENEYKPVCTTGRDR